MDAMKEETVLFSAPSQLLDENEITSVRFCKCMFALVLLSYTRTMIKHAGTLPHTDRMVI